MNYLSVLEITMTNKNNFFTFTNTSAQSFSPKPICLDV